MHHVASHNGSCDCHMTCSPPQVQCECQTCTTLGGEAAVVSIALLQTDMEGTETPSSERKQLCQRTQKQNSSSSEIVQRNKTTLCVVGKYSRTLLVQKKEEKSLYINCFIKKRRTLGSKREKVNCVYL